MNSPEKHKPLSPEELLEWLDKKSDPKDFSSFSNSEFDELDEFEKEAIEGFKGYSTPNKAKALMDEINQEISKKVALSAPAVKEEASKKNRIIWFSAAASLVLVLSLSIFLINKTQTETGNNIALNNESPKDGGKEETAIEHETKPDEISGEIKAERTVSPLAKTTEGSKQMPLEKLAEETIDEQAARANEPVNTGVANGVVTSSFSQNQIDLAKNKDNANGNVAAKADADVAVNYDEKAVMPVMQNIETKEEAKKKTKQEEEDKNVSDAVAVSEESLAQTETIVMNEKSINDSKFKERKVAKKAAVTKAADTSPMYLQNTATTSLPSGYVVDGVYKATRYEGGEMAIKTYVLNYLKKKSNTQIIKGAFKVNGTVSEKGKLLVDSVTSINGECKDCENILKNALNEMPDWKPAMQGDKPVSSKTSFSLSF